MAGDPNNPFNDKLVEMNGDNYGPHTLALINHSETAVSGKYLQVNSNNYGQGDLGTITVVSYTYVRGFDNYGDYTPPIFGQIQYSSNPGNTFNIIGFSDHGLLLYKVLTPNFEYMKINYISQNFTTYILSPNGFSSPDGVSFPVTFGYKASDYVACFGEGTRLATPVGLVAVEDLAAGDLVLTANGAARPVRWVGQTATRPAVHQRPQEVNPVRIKARAFAADVPARDVRVSPGHAVYVDGVLVPAGRLVNGATIVQEAVEAIRYFHVELDSHDLLLAEGLPCESYMDDGNRASFTKGGEVFALNVRLDPKAWEHACAPLVAAGPQLVELQQRLLARAEALGWVRSDAAMLTIRANGVDQAAVHRAGNRHWFLLPTGGDVVLQSPHGVLAELVPGLTDPRRLGVAVGALRVDGTAVPLDDAAFGAGFHALEQDGGQQWRWTDGAGRVTLGGAGPVLVEVEILIVAPSWIAPSATLRSVA